jgi:hypothetical protein
MKRAEEIVQTIPCTCELCGVSIMLSWVVEEWNSHESNHFCSPCQATWSFAIIFQNKPLLSSSFDSLRSLNVYMSSPWHYNCLSFILLLMMVICGAQGRIKIKDTCITYIAKSKTGSKKKSNHTIRSRCARVWM